MNILDQEEIHVSQGQGLDIPAGTHPVVLWGIMTYQDFDYNDDSSIVDKKMIVVQFPTNPDSEGLPKVGWAYANESMNEKSNLHKHLKGFYGESIGQNHYIRLPNGSLDPKKIFGKNGLAVVGNVSKDEGQKKTGIISFATPISGMPTYQINESVKFPEYLINLKEGKHLNKSGTPATEAPAIPAAAQQAQKTTPPAPTIPAAPSEPVKKGRGKGNTTTTTPATVTPPVQQVQKPVQTAQIAPGTPTTPAPFKSVYRKIDDVQQHCSFANPDGTICGERQYTRDPANGGGWTCKHKHVNAESKESLLNPIEEEPVDDSEPGPEEAENVM